MAQALLEKQKEMPWRSFLLYGRKNVIGREGKVEKYGRNKLEI